ncbi:MAG: Nif3-like dinuclear metal center hexameric protein [Anaerolineae bacterium]|nr:Nif3-like dinuclear metal center hexameric protein [Anaerolineae bacterium]
MIQEVRVGSTHPGVEPERSLHFTQFPGGDMLSAGQVIERIQKNVGVPWRAKTVDTVILGNPETPVTGIATTIMATLDVLQRSTVAGNNLVITHEPTFYLHQDKTETLTEDEVYQFKVDFIQKHKMVIFHFHDHWHARRPDGIATGMVKALGWEKHADGLRPNLFSFPGIPLARFVKEIQSQLKILTMRVVGDPGLQVNRVTTSWGFLDRERGIQLLAQPEIEVVIAGETREWEVVEYAQDIITAGKKKALILLGHMVSEQAGMKYCAEWLRSFITEVPIEFISMPEPFWNPDHPVA